MKNIETVTKTAREELKGNFRFYGELAVLELVAKMADRHSWLFASPSCIVETFEKAEQYVDTCEWLGLDADYDQLEAFVDGFLADEGEEDEALKIAASIGYSEFCDK